MSQASTIQAIEAYLKDVFKTGTQRLNHIYQVKKVAVALGEIYHADFFSVVVASYLHDATKQNTLEENIRLAGTLYHEGIPKACLHAYAARNLAKTRFEINDLDILNAIQYHCSGRPNMSLLEKIIYVSDFIEEGRTFVDEALRTLAFKNLDQAVLAIMRRTKAYIKKQQKPFSALTEEAITYYQNQLEGLNGSTT